jgi:hypothetical protein
MGTNFKTRQIVRAGSYVVQLCAVVATALILILVFYAYVNHYFTLLFLDIGGLLLCIYIYEQAQRLRNRLY